MSEYRLIGSQNGRHKIIFKHKMLSDVEQEVQDVIKDMQSGGTKYDKLYIVQVKDGETKRIKNIPINL